MLRVEQPAFVLAGSDADDGRVVGCLVQSPEFTQFAVGVEALEGGGEFDEGEGEPEVFAEGGGDGFFAEEGELFEGGVVLEWERLAGARGGGKEEGGGKGEGTFRERVRE